MLNIRFIFFVMSIFLLTSCALSMQGVTNVDDNLIVDISNGLPTTGLWRQNLVLHDLNNDGILEIVMPPPRKAIIEQRRPFIFSYNDKEKTWNESESFNLLPSEIYNYGGVAVGDLNRDGKIDLVLANHEKKVIILINDGRGNFTIDYPVNEPFKSRTILLDDINGDAWLDIIALSEFFNPNEKDLKTGIMVGFNEKGKVRATFIEESSGIFGDSLAIGDINGDGKKDIIIAPLTGIKEMKKSIWLNDGKGGFKNYKKEIFNDKEIPFFVRTGDIDGDGKDEVIFKVSSIGAYGSSYLKVFKFSNDNLIDISKGLEELKEFAVFDISDIDNDKIYELGVLTKTAILIFKYTNGQWLKTHEHKIKVNDLNSVFDFKMARQLDGSVIFVFNLASEDGKENGIKAYKLVKEK